MPQKRPTYVELGYSGDFGLTGLTELLRQLCSPDGPAVDLPAALAVAAGSADGSDGEEAVELEEDARRLLDVDGAGDGPLSEEVLRTVWLAAAGRVFDPAGSGTDTRGWLRAVADLATERLRQNDRSYVPPPVSPVRDEELCGAVLAEIRVLAGELTRASELPELARSLGQVVARADADLGFRLFLRALKVYAVQVPKEQYDRFLGLGERLGYPAWIVRDGLDVDWPPIDTARRDTAWNFGLSRLAGNAHQDWHPDTARREIHRVADADDPAQSPGTAAALLLEDALRLSRSPLSDGTVTTLWVAVSDASLRMDGRDWLRLVADVCGERLREVAPAYTPVVPPAGTESVDTVLREIRETGLAVTDQAISPRWRPLPAPDAMAALEQVVTLVDPDLGFRLFLQMLRVLSVPLTRDQYERYVSIGAGFGYGECLVDEVEHLVRTGGGH
ncbi:hypothetical protein ACKI1I_31615 [Streptomyces turgidiscabies]|uniref:Uncharacterized protein n=1 Tax=Streptomyces turgidiscabies (strain Car8) TaxID=698760 RepID=L7F8W8_STRT8|nr:MULTISPECIES: hypothetical protein [Streptomyces]ELP67100.1 hypothetical protein STRTUCAR8_06805 [Streptomyces turgidiscabies Car8]MDX3499201.1 hypothetical protein [Streptomyces turgidiscabies]GAQ75628.1 hypothetical protein T45_07414 [Streptomyces turgidiscabies]